MARTGQRQAGASTTRQGRRPAGRPAERDSTGIIPQLARAVREVEASTQRGEATRTARTKFQVVALLMREERTRIAADAELSQARRSEEMKRLDGVAMILAKAASRDPSLLPLLGDGAPVSPAAKSLRREMLAAAGFEPEPEEVHAPDLSVPSAPSVSSAPAPSKQVVPQSVRSAQLANPFLAPDLSVVRKVAKADRLAGWDLLDPLFMSFEYGADGTPACMRLPDAISRRAAGGRELMQHQAQLVASAASGHRTFLLADEPGLGKTAQALLAAQAANAYPLLVVAPSVVKTNWAREVELWTPNRRATVVQGHGESVDAFADVVIVNYEVLDRHIGWLRQLGFKGMVVDEAHLIKNKGSKRSQHVLQISDSIRERIARPLLMALTGTPLINDIEDFRAIWQMLGWIDEKQPNAALIDALEDTGLTPMDPSFYREARRAVIDMGIVRRRKEDVAADIPARRIADIPVELDGAVGSSIAAAELELASRLVERYDRALENRTASHERDEHGIDVDLVRHVAKWELEDGDTASKGENIFSMVRRIGTAKAELSADYAAQLARSVGKVVLFAKHVDVMDVAEETFARRGIKAVSIRGNQTPAVRQRAIDAFVDDPDVQIAVCSLSAAGVGINLQVASNMVLAELSWTHAEQTQAIDRIHRIGQSMPVTVWRIIAAQTIDARIAELIDGKAGLAAKALDGSDVDVLSSADMQLEALAAMLTEALRTR